MRPFKMLGLAAIAAMGMMAFVGVGTASAVEEKTVLCSANQSPCLEENVLPTETPISAQSTDTVLQLTLIFASTVSCEESTFAGKTLEEQGQPQLKGEIETLTFTGCTDSLGRVCTATAIQLPYQVSIEQKIPNEQLGKLTVYEKWVGAQTGQPGAFVECQDANFLTPDIKCNFKANEDNAQAAADHVAKGGAPGMKSINLHTAGGNPAIIKVGQQAEVQKAQLKQDATGIEGAKCGGTNPKWFGNYTVTTPDPVWVSHVVK